MENNTAIAGSIIIAGLIIGGAVIMTSDSRSNSAAVAQANQARPTHTAPIPSGDLRTTIVDGDHIFGNPNAPITIIEYSDFECPFCARFHPTVEKLVRTYPDTVNWVYRQFPISSHRNAHAAAAASECVAKLAGNDAFWKFSSALLENQRRLSPALYASEAATFGISESDLTACMTDSEILERIARDAAEAPQLGANGTPFSIATLPSGEIVPIRGALPYEQLEGFVKEFLNQQ